MDFNQMYQTVNKILEGHRRGHYDIQEAVNLLEIFWQQQPEESRKDITGIMWTALAAEPLQPLPSAGNVTPNIHRVVTRSIATFGPTAELPARTFGLLRWDSPKTMEFWAQHACAELSYSMLHHAERFTQATLDQAKSLCAPYTYARAAQLTGTEFPQSVLDAAADLEKTIERVEYQSFAASLKETRQKPEPHVVGEASLLATPGLPVEVRAAMMRARDYLEGDGPFDPKHAADLIRTSIDETHRVVVAQLEKMTGRKYERPDEDGSRRAYMRGVGFISQPEEQFFSAIYSLLSKEGAHKLLAPKETVLVMEITVRHYLMLLLRRLEARRSSPPEDK